MKIPIVFYEPTPKLKRPATYRRQPVVCLDSETAMRNGYRKITTPYRPSEHWMLELTEKQLDYGAIGHCRVAASELVRVDGQVERHAGLTLWRE